MNLVHKLITDRVEKLLNELDELSMEIVADAQRKSTSTAMSDLITQKEIDPKLAKRAGAINIQLSTLSILLKT